MGVVGSISIKDNATATLKQIRNEQTAFRKDVVKTKTELSAAWDKTYIAKVDTTASVQKTEGLLGKVRQLGKEAVSPVIRVKDEATAKLRETDAAVKAAGARVASPVIRVKDTATSAIKKIETSVKAVGKKAASPVIRAKDMTSKTLGAVDAKMKALGSMVARPAVALKDGATAGLSYIKDMLGTLSKGVTIAATISGVGLTAVAGGALTSGAALEQNIGGIETLFKDSSGIVKANADKAFQTAGLSANSYMETVTGFSASLLQSLGGDTQKAAVMADMAIIDMADNANKMGTSMESIQNAYQGFAKQNYTMLDNLKLGYGGTKEEMERLLADAQALSGEKYDISSLADVYNAVHVIQESLDITGTKAKEANETFSGSFAAMKSAVSNLLGNLAIGGDVKTSMEQVVDSAATFLIGNAIPMLGNVFTTLPGAVNTGIRKAAPKIKKMAPTIIKGVKDGLTAAFPSLGPVIGQGIDTAISAFPSFLSEAKKIGTAAASIASGFAPLLPSLSAFGSSVGSAMQTAAASVLPVLESTVSTVQTVLPSVLPMIGTVVTSIGNLFAQASPIIGGAVSALGDAVSELAPVFGIIFSEISDKAGSVIGFLGERMGFLNEVVSTAAPAIGEVISTAWSVISPVMDLTISVFELLFGVVQRVFPGIQSILESVWSAIKPIVEGIGSAVGKVAGWIGSAAEKIGGGSEAGNKGSVGTNAKGDNNWKGGLTWVGEKGPELVNLPKGSRILPNKESIAVSNAARGMRTVSGAVRGMGTNVIQSVVTQVGGQKEDALRETLPVVDILKEILELLKNRRDGNPEGDSGEAGKQGKTGGIGQIIIQKLADEIIVRDEEDIDMIADQVAKKVLEVVLNMG